MTNEKAIMCLEDMKIKVQIPKAAKQARENNEALDVAIQALKPAEPKRGKWHYSDGKPAKIGLSFGVICDQCGTESEYCTNFCGECGADMREVTT